MHLPQVKTPGARNEILQGNESTNRANIEAYFLSPVTPRSTSRLCRAPVRMRIMAAQHPGPEGNHYICLLYTSDAADE